MLKIKKPLVVKTATKVNMDNTSIFCFSKESKIR